MSTIHCNPLMPLAFGNLNERRTIDSMFPTQRAWPSGLPLCPVNKLKEGKNVIASVVEPLDSCCRNPIGEMPNEGKSLAASGVLMRL